MTESILIVDDSTFIVEGLVALLKKSYRPIPSYSGEECLAILRKTTPSLIILDIMMEPMDGWETLSRIKEDPKSRHIPVLMFSAKKISWEEAEEHRVIIDDFISKPVNPKKLLDAIENVLARQEFNRQALRTWSAAGVNPEVIDAYLTQKMNLDVDLSLLSVMEKQRDSAYAGSAKEDLTRAIAALEARIASSRARIESFCRKEGGALPPVSRSAVQEEPAAGPETIAVNHESGKATAPEVRPPPVPASPPPSERSGTVAGDEALYGPGSAPGNAASRPESPQDTLPAFPVIRPLPDPVPVPTGPAVAVAPARRSPSVDEGPFRASPSLVGRDTFRPVTPAPGDNDLFEPYSPPPEPASPIRPESREVNAPIPSMPAHPAVEKTPLASPGSGTATPPLRTHAATTRIERAEQAGRKSRGGQEPRQGIVSRILEAIAVLFGRARP